MTVDAAPQRTSGSRRVAEWLNENRTRVSVLAVFAFLILAALSGLDSSDWFATIMQGLSVGALTFLVASGLSLILGLMDVLNLAHGEIFMLGAYIGWTIYTRFDTALDVAIPLLLLVAPFALMPIWRRLARQVRAMDTSIHFGLWVATLVLLYVGWLLVFATGGEESEVPAAEASSGAGAGAITLVTIILMAAGFAAFRLWTRTKATGETGRAISTSAWSITLLGLVGAVLAITRFPLVIWNPEDFANSPSNYSVQIDLGTLAPLEAGAYEWPAIIAIVALVLAGAVLALGLASFAGPGGELAPISGRHYGGFAGLAAGAIILQAVKEPLNEWIFGLSTTWRFFLAMAVATAIGAALGAFIEVILIRPLYDRPIYTLMITLGVGFILIELAREVWGRPEFTMARPAIFNGTGEGCPGQGFGGFFSGCSTVELLGSRLRVYNEGFVVLMGLIVLIGVTLLLQRTRIGMVIRAGVQDPEMVQALGINVRRVFTTVFALGSGLAALGGVLAAPSIGLSTGMGAVVLLGAIVALAIGGLTSFPGAAAGALLVGLLQQLIIRLGQTGINLPFLDEPFKPSPTVVPAASILVMVVILLVLPAGLFGRSER